MSTSRLHVVGSEHEARFAESFDEQLSRVISAAQQPTRARADLDELGLLSVLSHYAAAGSYRSDQLSVAGWGLEADGDNPQVRRHRFAVHYSVEAVDEFLFSGVAIAPGQTVVYQVAMLPEVDPGR